jgi:hypothetical protein
MFGFEWPWRVSSPILIQGPSPELVYEPYKQKGLIDFKLVLLLWDFYVTRYEG